MAIMDQRSRGRVLIHAFEALCSYLPQIDFPLIL